MSRVVITRKIYEGSLQRLIQAGIPFRLNEADISWSSSQLKENLAACAAVVCMLTDQMTAEVMDAAPSLKIICNVAVGYDNIDVPAATERGIQVTNTPEVLTETTADLAFALLLALARRLPQADTYMRAGHYRSFELFPELIGVDVYGKTLGIAGMGRIGTAVARRAALGFGMPVIYTANSPKKEADTELQARQVSFATLLEESDFISIHTPLNAETFHLFGLCEFQQMKTSAMLVNTARGPVINEAELVEALENGLIAGAALDVFEDEPAMHAGLKKIKDKLVVAPHLGSASVETRQNMSELAIKNAVAFLTGKRPLTPVNRI